MRSRFHHTLDVGAIIAAATILWATAARSEPGEKPAAGAKAKPVPQSVYAVPASPKEGRDPFFPDSVRRSRGTSIKPRSDVPAVTLKLNGFSPGLAMINGKTMAAGESTDITTPTRRVRIRLIEIREKDKSVLIEVDGEQRELTMPPGS